MDAWLLEFQEGEEAWQVCDALLHFSACPPEVRLFAAQTLRCKAQRDLEELPAGVWRDFRDSLLVLLVESEQQRYGEQVSVQLALAIAAVAAHVPAEAWGGGAGEAASVVAWLQRSLSAQEPAVALPCLLHVMLVLPQEAGSYKHAIRPARRLEFKRELSAAVGESVGVLGLCLPAVGSSAELRQRMFAAFSGWLDLSCGAGLDPASLASQPLVVAALACLGDADEEVFAAAIDCACELVRYTICGPGERIDPAHLGLVQALVAHSMQLRPRFLQFAEQSRAGDPTNDEDAKAIARLFTEVGEAYVQVIATGDPGVLEPVQALLDVVSFPDDTICSMSYNFWHSLAMLLHKGPAHSSDDEGAAPGTGPAAGALPPGEMERRRQLFEPAFVQLVTRIMLRCVYPEGFESWNRGERRDFKRSRSDIADTLYDAARVVGGEKILELLVQPLREMSATAAGGGAFDWRQAEAAYYCMKAVAKAVPAASGALLREVIGSLSSVPQQPQLLATSAFTVGSYSGWLARSLKEQSIDRPFFMQVLALLGRAMADAEAAGGGALAFKLVCKTCRGLLAPFLNDLQDLYTQAVNHAAGGAAGGVEQEGGLKLANGDVLQVVEGMSCIISGLPEEQVDGALQALAAPIVTQMQAAGSSQQVPLISHHVDKLTAVFKTMASNRRAVAQVLIHVWPVLDACLVAVGPSEQGAERITNCMRHGLRVAGAETAPMLQHLLATIPVRYKDHHHACLVYLTSELVKIYGANEHVQAALQAIVHDLLTETVPFLVSLQDFDKKPDVADDVFLLSCRVLKYCPVVILMPNPPVLLQKVVALAAEGIYLHHREACTSILQCLQRVCDLGGSHYTRTAGVVAAQAQQNTRGVLLQLGAALTEKLLGGLLGVHPMGRMDELSETLYLLLRATGVQGLQWIQQTLSRVPDFVATPGDVQLFAHEAQLASQQQSNEDAFVGAACELGELCRRNRKCFQTITSIFLSGALKPAG